MTVLYILGSLVLLIFLLLLMPLSLRAGYFRGELGLSVHYLFFRVRLSDKLTEKLMSSPEKEVKKEVKKQQKEEKTKADKTKGVLDTVKTVTSVLEASAKPLQRLRRNLVFYKVRINGLIGGEDAHTAALDYGRITGFVAVMLAVVGELFVLETPQVHLFPDFTKDSSAWDISLRIRIQPIVLLSVAVGTAAAYLRVTAKNKRDRKVKKSKGGHSNEPAASHQ